MKDIDNRGRVNRFKFLLYFYLVFVLIVFVYKFIIAPELPGLFLLVAFLPLLGFMSSLINWPVHLQVTEIEEGIMIKTKPIFTSKSKTVLVNKHNFDSYYETDHLHIGLQVLDERDRLKKHEIRVSWMRLKDLRAFEQKLREINPYAPIK